MRKFKKLSLILSLVMIFTALFSGTVFAAPRLNGENRIDTAIKIAEAGWPNGADTVIIAAGLKSRDAAKTATIFADALAGAPLAAALDAPILLVDANPNADLDLGVRAALLDLAPSKVVVLGGPDAVPASVVEQIKEDLGLADADIVRIEGKNRYETSAAIAKAVIEKTGADEALVVDGLDFGEALAVSAYAAEFGIPVVYREGLVDVEETVVDGDIYELSAEYAAKFQAPEKVLLATGKAFADAFVAAPYAAKINAPVVLVGDVLSDAAADFLASVAGAELTVLGGPNAVSEAIVADAEEAMVEEEELAVDVVAVGVKKLQAKFNKAVDSSKVSFEVKKGSLGVNVKAVTFAEGNTSATIELVNNLTQGEYTVTVKGLETEFTKTLAVEDEKVAAIEFLSDQAILVGNPFQDTQVKVFFRVLNQYGEDVTKTRAADVTFMCGVGSIDNTQASNGVLTITKSGQDSQGNHLKFMKDEQFSIVAYSGFSAHTSGIFKVAEMANVADIDIVDLYNEFGDALSEDATAPESFKLIVVAKDQYGNDVDVNALSQGVFISVIPMAGDTIGTIGSLSYETKVVTDQNGNSVTVPYFKRTLIDGEYKTTLALNGPLSAGRVRIDIMAKLSGDRDSYDVTINSATYVDTFALSAPAVAPAGEKVLIPFTAYDKNGKEITDPAILNHATKGVTVSINGSNVSFVKNHSTNKAELYLDLTGVTYETGKVIPIIANTRTTFKNTMLNVSVARPAEPAVITNVGGSHNMVIGGKAQIGAWEFTILDQYGRTISKGDFDKKHGAYKVQVTSSDVSKVSFLDQATTEKVDGNGNKLATINFDGTWRIFLKGNAKGSASITFALTKNGNLVPNSEYSFTARVVELKDVQSFELADFSGNLYYKGVYGHTKAVAVNGVLADGTKVSIPVDHFTLSLPDADLTTDMDPSWAGDTGNRDYLVKSVTSPAAIGFDTNGLRVAPVVVTVKSPNGAVVLTKNVTISNAAPKVDALELRDNPKDSKYGDMYKYRENNEDKWYINKVGDYVAIRKVVFDTPTMNNLKYIASAIVKAKDQYGVDMEVFADSSGTSDDNDTVFSAVIPSSFNGVTVNGDAIEGAAKDDTFQLTVISNTGKSIVFKVVVVD